MRNSVRALLGVLILVGLLVGLMSAGVTHSIPVGKVEGQFQSNESGKPLEGALVTFLELGQNKFLKGDQASVSTDSQGRFRIGNLAEGTYDVQVMARGHALSAPIKISVREGRTTRISKGLDRMPAEMRVYASRRVFLPEDRPFVQAQGFLRTKELAVKVYAMDLEDIVKSGDVRSALGENARSAPSKSEPVLDQTLALKSADGEGNFSETIEFESLKPGIYLLEAKGKYSNDTEAKKDGDLSQRALFFVSEVALVAKSSARQADLWLTDLKSGKPLAGQVIQLNTGGILSTVGRTNGDGLLETSLPDLGGQSSRSLAFVAQVAGSTAVTVLNQYGSDRTGPSTVVTDRPIYLPGDTVHFRAVFRSFGRDEDDLRLPSSSSGTAILRDNDGEVVATLPVSLTQFGSATGSFTLPSEDSRPFSIDFEVGAHRASKFVPVSAYRKPEFRVTVTPTRENFLRGDRVEMKVKCEYFFGGPVVGAKVTGIVQDGALWTWSDPESDEGSESYGSAESYLGDLPEGVTNDQGEAFMSFDSNQMGWVLDRETDRILQFDVSVSEDGERFYDGSGAAEVYRGDVDLRIEPMTWVITSSQEAEVDVSLRDLEGKPVAGKGVRIDHGVEVYHSNGSVFSINGSFTATTDSTGTARIKVPSTKQGDLHVRARTEDSRGRAVVASTSIWVTDAAYAWSSGDRDLNIALDKREYNPGEPMKVVVRGDPSTSGYAWLTLETGSIQEQKVVEWKSGVAEVEFTAPRTAAPNAFVAATMVRDRELVQRSRSFKISLRERELEVQITPDRSKTEPGQSVDWKIRTLADGKPVSAEVSLGVVDEAIYAIREDGDAPIEDFFPRRWSSVDTAFSFPEVYLDGGDKEGKQEVEMRSEFKDTADWSPAVITNEVGEATVRTELPDNITSWRATAVAVTKDTRVGKSMGNVVASKPLMVRLQAPLAMTQYDSFNVTAIVQSGIDQPMEVEANLVSEGATKSGGMRETFILEPGATKTLTLRIDAAEAGTGVLIASARSAPELSDGMRVEVPITPSATMERIYGNGELTGEAPEFTLNLPAGENRLNISVQNSRFGALLTALPELIEYPYGCTEQTINRFVPAVLARRALAEAGNQNPELEEKLPSVLDAGFKRLRQLQNYDGGWGWWENGAPDAFMTSIVLDGLAEARDAGVEIPRPMLRSARGWAERFEYGKKPVPPIEGDLNDDVQLASAAVRLGEVEPAVRFLDKVSPREVTDAIPAADAAIALQRSGKSARARAFLERAVNLLNQDGDERWYGYAARARVTGALIALEPGSARTEDAIGRLLVARKGRAWGNTYATAAAIRALLPLLGTDQANEALEVEIDGVDETLRVPATLGGEASLTMKTLESRQVKVRLVGGARAFVSIAGTHQLVNRRFEAAKSDRMEVRRTFHRLRATRNPDGSKRLDIDPSPIQAFTNGEVIRCRVVVSVKKATEFVMVEVPLPSNLRIRESANMEYWDYWFSGLEFFNDRVVFFARSLDKGEHVFDFHLRAENRGRAQVLPARAMPMYAGDDIARSSSIEVEVKP